MPHDDRRVLFVTLSDLSGQKGNSVATREIVRAFAEHERTDLVVACPEFDGSMPDVLSEEVDSIYHIPTQDDLSVVTGISGQLQLARTVLSVLETHEIDVIVARMYPTLVVPPLVATLKQLPYILLARGVSHRTLRFSFLLKRIFQLNARVADRVYAAYSDVKSDADRARRPTQPDAEIFSNAVDLDQFPTMSISDARDSLELPIGDDEFVIGSVSTLKPYHKVDELVRAVSLFNETKSANVTALIVGDGPEMEHIRRVAKQEDVLDQVVFTGFVPHEQVHKYISASNILYGGIDPDSPGNAIKCYEYLACARPLITDRRPEFDFIEREQVGELIDRVNGETIMQAMASLHSSAPTERRAMGNRGRQCVKENHTWSALVDTIVDETG